MQRLRASPGRVDPREELMKSIELDTVRLRGGGSGRSGSRAAVAYIVL
jgi:hypothetical protein